MEFAAGLVTLHDGVPVPKVIDFGIAKATQQELTEKTIFMKFQQFLGTPAYMSPEQAELIEQGCWRGTEGPNDYGEDPLASRTPISNR